MNVNVNDTCLKDIIHNSVPAKVWLHNGIQVWQRYVQSAGTLGSYYAQLRSSTTPMIAASASPGDPNGYTYSRSEMKGDVLAWQGKGACVKALTDCEVTVSGSIKVKVPGGGKVGMKGWYYKNTTQIKQIFWVYTAEQTISLSYKIRLKTGDILSVRTAPENSAGSFIQFVISARFEGVTI